MAKDFNAVIPIDNRQAQELIEEGFDVVPTQWIETDKNEHLRVPGGEWVPAKYKSRLVVRGDLDYLDIRSDSPTCEL